MLSGWVEAGSCQICLQNKILSITHLYEGGNIKRQSTKLTVTLIH